MSTRHDSPSVSFTRPIMRPQRALDATIYVVEAKNRARPPIDEVAAKRGGSGRISPSCGSCCESPNSSVPQVTALYPFPPVSFPWGTEVIAMFYRWLAARMPEVADGALTYINALPGGAAIDATSPRACAR
jgi:hypothetical protein